MPNQPAYNTYIGARYVPLIAGEWDNTKTYEPLTIVTNQGNSYTSRTYVPVGIDITNETYWTLTGNYNAQVEAYRQEVQQLSDNLTIAQDKLKLWVSVMDFGAKGDGTTDDTAAFQAALNTGFDVFVPTAQNQQYLIKNTLNINHIRQTIYGDHLATPAGTMNFKGRITFPSTLALAINITVSDVRFYNLNFAINQSGNPRTTTCIQASNTASPEDLDLYAEHCSFYYFQNAFNVSGRGLLIRDCNFITCSNCIIQAFVVESGGTGLRGPDYGYRAVRLLNNRFHDITSYVYQSNTNKNFGSQIIGNMMDTGWGFCRFNAGITNSIISDNIIHFPATVPIAITGDASENTISNNTFKGDASIHIPGAFIILGTTNSKSNTISGNTFDGCTDSAILINTTSSGNIISNNTFSNIGDDNANNHMPIASNQPVDKLIVSNNTLIPNSATVPAMLVAAGNIAITNSYFSGNRGVLYDVSGQYTLTDTFSEVRVRMMFLQNRYMIFRDISTTTDLVVGSNAITIPVGNFPTGYNASLVIYNNSTGARDVYPNTIFSGISNGNATFYVNSASSHTGIVFHAYVMQYPTQWP